MNKLNLVLLGLVFSFSLLAQDENTHIPWKLEGAIERIEKYRKGDATLIFEMPNGEKIKEGAKLSIELSKHQFKFGTSLTQSGSISQMPGFDNFRKHIKNLFNYVTIGYYWSMIEPSRGNIRIGNHIKNDLEWAVSNNLSLKGHPLLWHNTVPYWLKNIEDPKETEEIIYDHMRYLIEEFPQIEQWDVYNEAPAAFKEHVEKSSITRWVQYKNGINPAVGDLFKLTNEINPNKYFINNHYTHKHKEFKNLNQFLIENGDHMDAIGIQTHMHQKADAIDESELWDMLEEYAMFGKPIHLTELTMPSSERFNNYKEVQAMEEEIRKVWGTNKERPFRPSTPQGEKFQADYLKDFYTLAFSHPSVETIVIWNASDLNAWRGSAGGILDRNNNPKPAYDELYKLIKKEWHTKAEGTVDEESAIQFNGFYGEYKGEIIVGDEVFNFYFFHTADTNNTINIKLR